MPYESVSSVSVTRKYVAELAGVSPAVVTAALSDRNSTIGVSAQTRERVRTVARQLRYKPSILGRSLAQRKSFLIAVLSSEMMAHVIGEVAAAMEIVVADKDYSILVSVYPCSLKSEAIHIKRVLERRVDAVVVVPVLDPQGHTNVEMFEAMQNNGVPVVQLFTESLAGIASVVDDWRGTGEVATRHLIELGHQRILHMTHANYRDEAMLGSYRDALRRYEGYHDCMIKAGLTPEVVALALPAEGRTVKEMFYDPAYEAAYRIAHHPCRPTAVVTYDDPYALGLINGLMDLGVHVPEDISVVGYGDLPSAAISRPPLTTVKRSLRKMGQGAAQMLFAMMQNDPTEHIVLSPRLVLRRSTGPVCERRPLARLGTS